MKAYKVKIAYCFIAVAACCLIISGCARAPHLRPGYTNIQERVIGYHDAIRWKNYDTAELYILPQQRDDFRQYVESIEDKLSVEDYQMVKATRDNKALEADIVIKRNLFVLPSVTLKEDQFEQHWVFVGKEWYLSGPPY